MTPNFSPTWDSLDSRPIPTWFEDAKFGIFIHWGVYSVPAYRKVEQGIYNSYAEWYYARVMYNQENGGQQFHLKNFGSDFEYRDFAKLFKTELFDATSFADLFLNSGAKYVVLTAKHHDGYCLWPTENKYKKNWNTGDRGPHRDLVGEITQAVKKAQLHMGLYYSIPEWETHTTHRTPTGYFLPTSIIQKYGIDEKLYVTELLLPQLKELIEKYQPDLLFSDGGEWDADETFYQTKEFLAWLYNESPVKETILVNDRFAKGMPGQHGDYFSSEYKDMPQGLKSHPWEESRGIGKSYGLNRAEKLTDYSTTKQLIEELIDIVSRGGNLLLNIGPAADGTIPLLMQERLLDIGHWLAINGEAIYGTRKHPNPITVQSNPQVFFTAKLPVHYVLFTQWNNTIELQWAHEKKPTSIFILGLTQSLRFEVTIDQQLHIELPLLSPDSYPSTYAWALKLLY